MNWLSYAHPKITVKLATKTGRGRPKKSAIQERKTRGSAIPSAAMYRNDLQRRFLAEHSVAMLKQCCNNVVTCVALKIVVANRPVRE